MTIYYFPGPVHEWTDEDGTVHQERQMIKVYSMWSDEDTRARYDSNLALLAPESGKVFGIIYRHHAPIRGEYDNILDALNDMAYHAEFGEGSPHLLSVGERVVEGERLTKLCWWRANRLFPD